MPYPAKHDESCTRTTLEPFDLIEAFVETRDGVTQRSITKPSAVDYDPTGNTDVLWDTQQTIGNGCPNCGVVSLDDTIVIANVQYVRSENQ